MERIIHEIPQHHIDWEKTGTTQAEFMEAYAAADSNTQRALLDSILVWTNPEWLELRAGRFTCSKASEFLADPVIKADKEAGKIGETAKKLCYKVMAEHYTNWREPEQNWADRLAVKRGLCFEPIARQLTEEALNTKIKEVGIITYGDFLGYSPDGLDANDPETAIEIKCYEPAHYLETLMNAADKKVQLQMQMALWVAGLKRIYFVLYCPEIDPKHVTILKYTKGIKYQKMLEDRAIKMIEYMKEVSAQKDKREIVIETAE